MPRSARSSKKETGTWSRVLKWIGGVTAIISFLLGVNQVTGLVQKFRIHHKEFSEAMLAGGQQLERMDYPAAFTSFKHAVELDPIDREAQSSEARAAMLWLETAHATADRSFTDVAKQLLPVLDSSLTSAKGADAADLLAHIGWANFLEYRDGQREGVTVEENYKKALDIDAGNVFAHAMWGHWILWMGGKLDDANEHFRAALAAGRVRPYVRQLQISALTNRGSDADAELLRVANEMRRNGESISDAGERSHILWANFDTRLRNHDQLVQSLSILPAADTEATYDWLAGGERSKPADRWVRDFLIANLREIGGNPSEALAQYQALQKDLRGTDHVLIPYVNQAIQRVSARK